MNKKKNKDYALTVSGNEVLKANCILINKEYYEKNVDCFLINYKGNERWVPYDNSYCFNFVNGQYEKRKLVEEKGLTKFLIGFGGKQLEKLVFGYDVANFAINTKVFSHYGNKSSDYQTYQTEVKRAEERIAKYKEGLQPQMLFNDNYGQYVDIICKLYYYRNFINKELPFPIEDITLKDFVRIIREVENYTLRDMDIRNDYQEFYNDYCSYVHTGYDPISPEDDPENNLQKITFEIVQQDPVLMRVFDFVLSYFEITSSLKNKISVEKIRLQKYNAKLKEIRDTNFFSEICRTKEDAITLGFIECFSNDSYYLKRNLNNSEILALSKIPSHNQDGSYSKNIRINYNANQGTDVFTRILESYYLTREENTKLEKRSYNIARLLSGLTFGIEFETCLGRIREPDLHRYGIIPLRDGSVSGFEYTTIPYGYSNVNLNETSNQALAKDLTNLKELCNELTKRCQINSKCSMHIHIGGVRKDKLYLLAVYMLCYMIQDEMFEMFPKFKEDSPKYLGTQKNYCKKLDHLDLFDNCIFDKSSVLKENYCDSINEYFNRIFKLLSDGQDIGSKFNRKLLRHPIDQKWNRHGRYHWVNLVNSVFSNSRTIEFRLHTATLNFTKTLNWMLICSAIVKFADTHTKEIVSGQISKISLDEVIGGYCNNFRDKKKTNDNGLFVHKYLNEYINTRKVYFANKTVQKDFVCEVELEQDKNFVFNYMGVTSLI